MEETNDNKKFDFNILPCYFIVYCFIGWIYEVIWEFKVGNGFVNRGFLYGPYLPIYGFRSTNITIYAKQAYKK